MKKMLILCCILISFTGFAQHNAQEIKKFKISKITRSSVTSGEDVIRKSEVLYDEKGNDTAEYNDGNLYRRTVYEYNSKGQVVKMTRYWADGKEIATAEYKYKPDGSYIIANTDKDFGMTDFTHCDKAGKITKTISPDRSERIYSYDTKGRLTKVKSKPSDNGGVVVDLQYTYNPKGQLIKQVNKGDYKWTASYIYDAKGMISKCVNANIMDGVAEPEMTTSYEYEFRK